MLQNNNLLDLQVTEETKTSFNGLAQWMNIYAIISLISLVVSVITTVMTVSRFSRYETSGSGSSFFGLAITTGISLLMNLTLLAAAKNIKGGIAGTDQGLFNLGIRKFNSYFLIYGIITIIVMVIVFLVTIILVFAQSRGGF